MTASISEKETEIDSLNSVVRQQSDDLTSISFAFEQTLTCVNSLKLKCSEAYSSIESYQNTVSNLTNTCESQIHHISELEKEIGDLHALLNTSADRDSLLDAYSSMVSTLSRRLHQCEAELMALHMEDSVRLNNSFRLRYNG